MNGPNTGKKYIDSIDVNSPEYLRDQYRPAEVKQDVRQMAERKRVNEILKSKQFRDELEDVVVDKIKSFSPDRASILALQQMSELILPQAKLRHGPVYGRILNPVVPISDLNKEEGGRLERGEKQLRNKLASCYRIIDEYKWSRQNQPTYISGRLGHNPHTILISPGDKSFSDLTASSLITLNEEGRSISGQGGVDEVATVLHAGAYLARGDIKSVMLIRADTAVAMASTGSDLLPLSRDAVLLGRVPCVELNEAEDIATQLTAAFQKAPKAIIVRGVGALVVGESVEETFISGRKLLGAMETQLRVGHVGLDNLHILPEEVQRKMLAAASKKQRSYELEFESLMRHLENAGHCTGYLFRESLFRKVERVDKVNAEVELPPTVVSLGLPDDDENDRPREKKPLSYAEYLNSPNTYKKEEVEVDLGTPYNKRITKWVQESSPAGNLIKIDSPNQFAPVGANPKELKDTMKKICREYYDENITAGPQSKILGGLTWEEAQKIKDKNAASETVIMVGAASRGIIQKGHQAQGNLYRTYYAPNPFANVTDDEVDAYKSEVVSKTGGESAHIVSYGEDQDNLVPGPDGRLISTDERIKQVKQQQQQLVVDAATAEVVSDVGEEEASKRKQAQQIQELQQQHQQQNQIVNDTKPISSVPGYLPKGQGPISPAKSLSSGEATAPEATSGTEKSEFETSGTEEKKKKKKGFRMPSFSKKKDKK